MEKNKATKEKGNNEKARVGVKVLKVIFILIGIVVMAYVLIVIRNTILLQQIIKKSAQYDNITNYSYKTKYYNENDMENSTEHTVYEKDNIIKMSLKTSRYELIIWKNNETNEAYMVFPEEKKILTDDANNIIIGYMPKALDFFGAELKFVALMSVIYEENVNGQECYVVNQFGSKEWISKETGLVVKRQNGYMVENGEKFPSYIEYIDWQIDKVTDSQVEKPNLTEYTQITQ